jgi:hypothetical protein
MKKLLLFTLFSIIALTSCGGVTPIPAQIVVTQIATPSLPDIVITHPELEVITPENVCNGPKNLDSF